MLLIQIGWCERCQSLQWGPQKVAIPACGTCGATDKMIRANLSKKASAIMLKVYEKAEAERAKKQKEQEKSKE